MHAVGKTTTPAWRQAAVVAVAGLATGVLTQVGQGALPDDWSQAANAISPWLLVAFLVGSTMPDPRRAALAGIGTLVLALVGYDAMILLRYGYGPGASSTVFWGIGALVGGPVFGIAGTWWHTGPPRRRAIAIGFLVAVFVAEGLRNALMLAYPAAGSAFIIVGLLLPLILGRSRGDRVGAYVATVPLLGLGVLGYLVFMLLNDVTAGLR